MQIRTLVIALAAAAVVAAVAPADLAAQQPAPRAGQATVGGLMSALNTVNVQITRLQGLGGLTAQRVRLVDVRDVLTDATAPAFDAALSRNETEVLNLRNVLTVNEAVRASLGAGRAPVTLAQIVAIDVLGSGEVVVFYRPAPQD